jgi:hypothetical protein
MINKKPQLFLWLIMKLPSSFVRGVGVPCPAFRVPTTTKLINFFFCLGPCRCGGAPRLQPHTHAQKHAQRSIPPFPIQLERAGTSPRRYLLRRARRPSLRPPACSAVPLSPRWSGDPSGRGLLRFLIAGE